jgi:hypothetical protein
MAQTQFIDRRNPSSRGRRSSDSGPVTGVGSVVRGAAETAGRAVATAVGMAAGAAAAVIPKTRRVQVDAATEERYWLENYAKEPYYDPGYSFEDYLPAYRAGWQGRARFPNRSFEQVERELQLEYSWNRGESRLLWEHARQAMRAAWDRVERA